MSQLSNPEQTRLARRNRVIKVVLDDLAQSHLPSITSLRLAQHALADEFHTSGNQLSSTAFRDLLVEDVKNAKEAQDSIKDILGYDYLTDIIQVGNVSIFDNEDLADVDGRISRAMDRIENIFSEFENYISDNPEYADFIVVNTEDGRVLKIPRRAVPSVRTGILSRRNHREQKLARIREKQLRDRAPLGHGRGIKPTKTAAYIMRISEWNAIPIYQKKQHIARAGQLGMPEIKRLCYSSNEEERSEGSLLKRASRYIIS